MSELVLAINRTHLHKQGIHDSGLCSFDLSNIDNKDYALLPRNFADNKSDAALVLGTMFGQILGYVVVMDEQGRVLTYQRKGKEKGLLGKWSIGVGGHINHDDFYEVYGGCEQHPDIQDIIMNGTHRELEEELGIDPNYFDIFNHVDDFIEGIKFCISSYDDPTSSVHVGLPFVIRVNPEDLTLDPKEFNNVEWLDWQTLMTDNREFETWSRILIQNWTKFMGA